VTAPHLDRVDVAKQVIPGLRQRSDKEAWATRRRIRPGPDPFVCIDDETTLDRLYERYASYVGALALRLLGRAAEVEDVVQDVFAAAVRGLRRRDNAWEIKGWLAKVTVRRCTWELRTRKLWAIVDRSEEANYDELADPSAGPEERHLISEVYRALDRLPAHERVPWTLRHVDGESVAEVAILCRCSRATAKRRIAQAHAKICRELGEPT
jgi:RNA polymerase sigma-70 factor (ECF subfamily)